MVVISGTKRKLRSLGWVVDFCPICRRARPFELFRMGFARHLYYISFGEGKLGGFLMDCHGCNTRMVTERDRYAEIAKTRGEDFAALAAKTMPDLPERLGERLALEKKIAEGRAEIDEETRRELLLERFAVAECLLSERFNYATTVGDRHSTIGCLGTLLLVAGLTAVVTFGGLSKDAGEFMLWFSGALLLIGLIYTVAQLRLASHRWVRAELVPRLAKSLRGLAPSREELNEAIARCRKQKWKVGGWVKPGPLLEAMQSL